MKNHYEYSEQKRPSGCKYDKAEIEHLDIIDNTSGIFEANEPIKLKVHCRTKEDNLGDFSFRIMLWRNDEAPVSTFFSKPFANINEAREFDAEIIINKHNLGPGVYKAILTLSGNNTRHYGEEFDQVNPAFTFEVTNFDGERRRWPREWGNSEFTDVDINLI